MNRAIPSWHRVPTAALLLLTLMLQACMQWIPQRRSIPAVLEAGSERRLRVIQADGEVVVLRRPRIVADSVLGEAHFGRGQWRARAVALSNVRRVEVERVNARRTIGATTLAGVAAAVIIAAATYEPPPPPPPPPSSSGCSGTDCYISCPLVYSWDGNRWRLDSGTFGGAIMRALQRTDLDNLDFATAQDGTLRLKLTNELQETDYVDALGLLAVDHDPALTVAPDAAGRMHTMGPLAAPSRATDFRGRDALARVGTADGWSWESGPSGRDTANLADIRDGLELEFVRPRGARHAHLVLDGHNSPWAAKLLADFVQAHGAGTQAWYDSLNATPERAHAMGMRLAREAFLGASVWTGGEWVHQGLFWEAGPEVIKRQVMDLDLSAVRGDTVRIKLESVPLFWMIDQVGLDFTVDQPVVTRALAPARAQDSRGRAAVALLAATDDRYLVMETGDVAELEFDVPDHAPGLARTYLLSSTGWYRIRVAETGEPDIQLLNRVANEPMGISRLAVARLNQALLAMARAAK
ncbi:MAG TPA: hypothetical protein VF970_13105 [Gemmatimonadales bacterium]